MAKFFIIKASPKIGSFRSRTFKVGKRASIVYHFTRYFIIMSPVVTEPYNENYVTYRLKKDRNSIYGESSVLQWVIRVPDSYVMEFKLKYSEQITKEYG